MNILLLSHTHTESPSLEQGVGMPPLIANELKEIKLTQLEPKVQQSLQLQEIKSSLQSLERTVKNLSEKSEWLTWTAFCHHSVPIHLVSPQVHQLSQPAVGSPPFFPTSPSSNLHPRSPHYLANRWGLVVLHLPVGTFSRTAMEVLAVGRGIAALRVVECWSWKGEYLQPGMKLWPVVMVTMQLWVEVPPQVVSCSTKVPRHNS